ncbi:MAG: hypothetical protein DRJ03_31070 [Chloroflexi bacterium]|nr:MAG: hypothetical protein DRJ03_31070 [Chloroflexota bacterium]
MNFHRVIKNLYLLYPTYVMKRIDYRNPKRSIRSLLYLSRHFSKVMEGRLRLVSGLTRADEAQLGNHLIELNRNSAFFEALDNRFKTIWPGRPIYPYDFETKSPDPGGSVFFQAVTMYLLVRATKPETVVETGGASGKSAAFILQGLEDNEKGTLYTLDLHPGKVEGFSWWPQGQPSCFLVPDHLRHRHQLRLGDAKETLPRLLDELEEVDLFRHDSDHSYDHMIFEFRTVWPMLDKGDILVSDDIQSNRSFFDFCEQVGSEPFTCLSNLGGIRK